ncbi:MAG: hypothetical protein KDD52_01970 [Bdellovibrionales bacterium]|nr:hypothetical protein [Bdellovibrionales bacterium]
MTDIAQAPEEGKEQTQWREVENWQLQWEQWKNQEEDLLERSKRYGEVRRFFDEKDYYALRVFLPQKTPLHPFVFQYDLPKTLPPYEIHAELRDEGLTVWVTGRLREAKLEKLCGHVNSFPDRFVIEYPLPSAATEVEIAKEPGHPYQVDIIMKKGKSLS